MKCINFALIENEDLIELIFSLLNTLLVSVCSTRQNLKLNFLKLL